MIKHVTVVLIASFLVLFATGCAGVATPAVGLLYTDVKWDGDVDGSTGPKRGEACANAYLGLLATGDASVDAAARNGGISKVSGTDHTSMNILGLYGEYCTIAYGS